MKKLFLLIIILTLNLFAQGWNNIVTTDIVEPYKTDIFTNSSGIHIIIQNSGNDIVYYNLNSEGIVCTTKTCTLGTSGSFPNIVGTNDKIYAIYKTVDDDDYDVIRVKYSTDNGSSWLTDIEDRPTTEYDCNGVDAVYEANYGVHIVWATQDGGTSGFETYYYRLNTFDQWVDPKTVTDDDLAQYGGNPSVVVSPNRVHVSFNTDATTNLSGVGDVKTRDKLNGNWQDPQTVVSGSSEQSIDERLLVRGAYLYLFYNRDYTTPGAHDLRFRTRRADDTQGWSDFTTLELRTLWQFEDAFEITKTNNDNIYILYKKYVYPGNGWSYAYKYYTGTNWITTSEFNDQVSVAGRQIGLSSVSNDLFCTWVKWETPTKYLRFRQYDAIPLAPTGLTITEDVNHHPILNWNVSPEPDRYQYNVYRLDGYVGGGWQVIAQVCSTCSTTYTDETLSYCHAVPPATCENYRNVSYRVTVVDYADPIVNDIAYESNPSNEVSARLTGGGDPEKISVNPDSKIPNEYLLAQNFPNPFNPTTTINYSIKSVGEVTLKVYDMLGAEVASLVNEGQEVGNYSVEFNASELPSGIYVYRLTAGSFVDNKKLILLK
jgi:hypothetical protein